VIEGKQAWVRLPRVVGPTRPWAKVRPACLAVVVPWVTPVSAQLHLASISGELGLLEAEGYAPTLVDAQNLDLDGISSLDEFVHARDKPICELRDVHKAGAFLVHEKHERTVACCSADYAVDGCSNDKLCRILIGGFLTCIRMSVASPNLKVSRNGRTTLK
jgi:hypothetical protein